eukprot:3513783-Rhodomonas_salina.4
MFLCPALMHHAWDLTAAFCALALRVCDVTACLLYNGLGQLLVVFAMLLFFVAGTPDACAPTGMQHA